MKASRKDRTTLGLTPWERLRNIGVNWATVSPWGGAAGRVPRRRFLMQLALAAGATFAGTVRKGGGNAAASTGEVMLDQLSHATFAPYLGDEFRIRFAPQESCTAELIAVTALRPASQASAAMSAGRAPFSIVFRAPMEALFPQKIYRIDHDRMGTFSLFLVPIGPDERGMRFEAVFG